MCDVRRLAPQDYHRFHAPVDGEVVGIAHAGADLYSVKVAFIIICYFSNIYLFSTMLPPPCMLCCDEGEASIC